MHIYLLIIFSLVKYGFQVNITNGCPEGFQSTENYCFLIKEKNQNCPHDDYLSFPLYISELKKYTTDNYYYYVNAKKQQQTSSIVEIKERGPFYQYHLANKNYPAAVDNFSVRKNNKATDGYACSALEDNCRYGTDYVKACVYSKEISFCNAYDNICEADNSLHCSCYTLKGLGHFCRKYCDITLDIFKCLKCDTSFTKYGEASLNLTLTDDRRLFLDINNYLKLASLNSNYPAVCYSNAIYQIYHMSDTEIFFEFSLVKTEDKLETYEIIPTDGLNPGEYWCTGFTYPNFNTIKSNVIYVPPIDPQYTLVIEIAFRKVTELEDILPELNKLIIPENLNASLSPVTFEDKDDQTIIMVHISGIYNEIYNDTESVKMYLVDTLKEQLQEIPKSTSVCLEEEMEVDDVIIVWKEADIGTSVASKPPCYDDNNEIVYRSCIGNYITGAYFSEVNCTINNKTNIEDGSMSKRLEELLYGNFTATELAEGLWEVLDKCSHKMQPNDVFLISNIIEKLSYKRDSYEITTLAKSIGLMIDVEKNVLITSQEKMKATDSLLKNIDKALESYVSYLNEDNEALTTNFMLRTLSLDENDQDFNFKGVAFYSSEEVFFIDDLENITQDGLLYAVLFSDELKEEIGLNSSSIVTSLFRKPTLFIDDASNEENNTDRVVSSIFTTNYTENYLTNPLIVAFKKEQDGDYLCVHWKYGGDKEVYGNWVINNNSKSLSNLIVCEFYHMTHFSVILNLPSDRVLNIISLVGSTLSLCCISGIYFTAFLSRKWRETESAKISLSSCATIVIQLVFLLIADVVDPKNYQLCLSISITLHYGIISQFCWMSILGVLQYRKFVVVFTGSQTYLFLICSLIGWIVPLIPIMYTIILFKENYISEDYCYLNGNGLYFGVILPVSISIIVNVCVFARIFYEFASRKKNGCVGVKQRQYHLYVKLSVYLFFLLGFTWIFGLLNGFLQSLVLSYIFSICASFQGAVLFWYHIVLNTDAKRAWSKTLKQFSTIRFSDESSATGNKSFFKKSVKKTTKKEKD